MVICWSSNVGSTGSYNTIKGRACLLNEFARRDEDQNADDELHSGGALPSTEQGRACAWRGVDCRF